MKNILFIINHNSYNSKILLEELNKYNNIYNIVVIDTSQIFKTNYSVFDLVVVKVVLGKTFKKYLNKKCKCPIMNTIESQIICDDKRETYNSLYNIVDMPKTYMNEYNEDIFPIIVKEPLGSLGKQVWKCDKKEDLEKYQNGYKKIYQEYIETGGSHIRVIIIGGNYIGAIKLSAIGDNIQSNFSSGGTATTYEPSQEIIDICINACNHIGVDYCGVDILIDKNNNKPYLCEMNSNAATRAFDQTTGINTTKIYLEYIFSKLE